MGDLSEEDKLFLWVGRCLTAWNRVESRIVNLLDHAYSSDGVSSPGEVVIGYWSIVSFEARLKWCDSVVSYRVNRKHYEDLATEWNSLNNHVIKKARKRAEIAHGSVVNTHGAPKDGDTTPPRVTLFVPQFEKQMLSWNLLPHRQHMATPLTEHLSSLTADDLAHRAAGFAKTEARIRKFLRTWRERDKQTGWHA